VKGSAAVAQALGLDASLAEAYAAMGQLVQNFEWDLRSAESYYQRALNYQPGYATAHQWYAETLTLLGRFADAERHSTRVLATDPLSPTALYVDAFLRTVRGRTDEGLARWRELNRLHPDYVLGGLHHAYAAAAAGRRDVVASTLLRLAGLVPQRSALYEGLAAAFSGEPTPAQTAAARAALARAGAGIPASERAAWHVVLGDRAAALAALAQGVEDRDDVNLPYILVHPLLRPLHDEPRFRSLMENLDFRIPS
jgi:tetratricopeptide (TPR) repeat protein